MMKRLFAILIPVMLLFIVGCTNYGKRVEINDRIEVYLNGDSVTETDAKALGNYIANMDKDGKNQKSFQLSKEQGVFVVKMPVDTTQNKIDASLDASFQALRLLIEMEVFKNQPVSLVLTDNKFNPFKTYAPGANTETIMPADENDATQPSSDTTQTADTTTIQ